MLCFRARGKVWVDVLVFPRYNAYVTTDAATGDSAGADKTSDGLAYQRPSGVHCSRSTCIPGHHERQLLLSLGRLLIHPLVSSIDASRVQSLALVSRAMVNRTALRFSCAPLPPAALTLPLTMPGIPKTKTGPSDLGKRV
jgi:hypothetical protein